jgi:hypothetical protein
MIGTGNSFQIALVYLSHSLDFQTFPQWSRFNEKISSSEISNYVINGHLMPTFRLFLLAHWHVWQVSLHLDQHDYENIKLLLREWFLSFNWRHWMMFCTCDRLKQLKWNRPGFRKCSMSILMSWWSSSRVRHPSSHHMICQYYQINTNMKENNKFDRVERLSVKNMKHNSNHYKWEIKLILDSWRPVRI